MGYVKISKHDVLLYWIERQDKYPMDICIIQPKYVAKYFETSMYQARKCIKELVLDGLLKYRSIVYCDPDYETGDCCCESHLPVHGYVATSKLIKQEQK